MTPPHTTPPRQKIVSLKPRVAFVDTYTAQPLPTSLAYSDPRRGSAASRGYGAEWRKLRLVVLKRDQYRCLACKRLGLLVPATDVDHIVSKAQGGDDDPGNLQSLCSSCHAAKTARERISG